MAFIATRKLIFYLQSARIIYHMLSLWNNYTWINILISMITTEDHCIILKEKCQNHYKDTISIFLEPTTLISLKNTFIIILKRIK